MLDLDSSILSGSAIFSDRNLEDRFPVMKEKSGRRKELNFDNKNVVKNFNQTSENIEKCEYFPRKELPWKIFS